MLAIDGNRQCGLALQGSVGEGREGREPWQRDGETRPHGTVGLRTPAGGQQRMRQGEIDGPRRLVQASRGAQIDR